MPPMCMCEDGPSCARKAASTAVSRSRCCCAIRLAPPMKNAERRAPSLLREAARCRCFGGAATRSGGYRAGSAMADEPDAPEDARADEPAELADAAPSPPPPEDGGGRLSVKVLVVALVVQLVLFGGLIALA